MKRLLCLCIIAIFLSASIASSATRRYYGKNKTGTNYSSALRKAGAMKTYGLRRDLAAALPSSFSWPAGTVKDQGTCGSCWAFAAASAYQSKLAMKGFGNITVSEQQQISCNVTACDFMGCNGGLLSAIQYWETVHPMRDACTGYPDKTTTANGSGTCPSWLSIRTCAKLGCDPDQVLPFTSGYYTVSTTSSSYQQDLKSSIYWDGPGILFLNLWDNNADPNDGVEFDQVFWPKTDKSAYKENGSYWCDARHMVALIGWDDSKSAWLCKNSWGSGGPNGNGTFWLAYTGHKHQTDATNPTFLAFANENVFGGNFWIADGTGSTSNIYRYNELSTSSYPFSSIMGQASVVTGDPRGGTWIIDKFSGNNGTIWERMPGGTWKQVKGIVGQDIALATNSLVSNGPVMYLYATDASNKLYTLNSAGNGWTQVSTTMSSPGGSYTYQAKRVDVDCNGTVYIVDIYGNVLRQTQGTTAWNSVGSLTVLDIGTDPRVGTFAIDNAYGYIYMWNETSQTWSQQFPIGGFTKIDVGPEGVLALMGTGQVVKITPSTSYWAGMQMLEDFTSSGGVSDVGCCSWQ
jgi:hypothetical protein